MSLSPFLLYCFTEHDLAFPDTHCGSVLQLVHRNDLNTAVKTIMASSLLEVETVTYFSKQLEINVQAHIKKELACGIRILDDS